MPRSIERKKRCPGHDIGPGQRFSDWGRLYANILVVRRPGGKTFTNLGGDLYWWSGM